MPNNDRPATYPSSPVIRRCKVCGTATASANRLCTRHAAER